MPGVFNCSTRMLVGIGAGAAVGGVTGSMIDSSHRVRGALIGAALGGAGGAGGVAAYGKWGNQARRVLAKHGIGTAPRRFHSTASDTSGLPYGWTMTKDYYKKTMSNRMRSMKFDAARRKVYGG